MRPADPQPVPRHRLAAIDELLSRVRRWAPSRPDVHAVALVGSWARGDAHAGSDVDLVLITDTPHSYVHEQDWLEPFGAGTVIRTQAWGPLTERRVQFDNGLLVEFGIVTPAWASTEPVDPGTRRVTADGMVILHDPDEILVELLEAVNGHRS